MSQKIADVNHYGLNSQGAGLLPLLLPMFLNNFFTYIVSYQIAIVFCILGLILFAGLFKVRVYQFMFIPTTITLALYSIFLITKLKPVLIVNSPLISEWLFVAVLAIFNMFKRQSFLWFRTAKYTGIKRKRIQAALTEYHFLALLTQNLYTLHLFILVFYMILPDDYKSLSMERLIYTDAPLLIGIFIIIFEQIRMFFIKRHLRREKWLPIMDKKGKVIGRIPFSTSLNSQSKYCHPVVRIAVVYNGMFYLLKRKASEVVSPSALDYPFYEYVLYKQSIEDAVTAMVGHSISTSPVKPRLLIRYPFENDRVNSFVSLYVISVRTEEQFTEYIKKPDGKLWTQKQIEENLGKGVFSEYFEKEYPYLQSTVLLAEGFSVQNKKEVPNGASVKSGKE